MAEYLIKDTTLTDIADKTRALSGMTGKMTPSEIKNELDEASQDIGSQEVLITQIASALEGKATPAPDTTIQTATVILSGALIETYPKNTVCYTDESGAQTTTAGKGTFTCVIPSTMSIKDSNFDRIISGNIAEIYKGNDILVLSINGNGSVVFASTDDGSSD